MELAHERALYNLAMDVSNNTSKGSIPDSRRGYRTPKPTNPRLSGRKSIGGGASSARKKARKETPTTSIGSTLTNINSSNKGAEPVIDY